MASFIAVLHMYSFLLLEPDSRTYIKNISSLLNTEICYSNI